MKINHTPGPWKVGEHTHKRLLHAENAVEVQDARGYMVACLFMKNRDMDGRQDAANARLIAAAPDLLDALKMALAGGFACPAAVERVMQDAIAKAEGPVVAVEGI